MVILIFIFLTPKSWFSSGERAQRGAHQSPVAQTLVLSAEVIGNEQDRSRIEQQIQTLTGRTNVEVVAVRKVLDPSGKIRSFEVDIR